MWLIASVCILVGIIRIRCQKGIFSQFGLRGIFSQFASKGKLVILWWGLFLALQVRTIILLSYYSVVVISFEPVIIR